jgi:GTP cyclohydrolase I
MKVFNESHVQFAIKELLIGLGVSLRDPNFKDTPARVARSYAEIFSGLYDTENKLKEIFKASFPSTYTGMVIVDNIHCFSMCPHHLLPVEYFIKTGYIANKKMLGLSKIPRVVELLAKRPELQETFTQDICDTLKSYLNPAGVMVVVHGSHNCLRMRGAKKEDAVMVTSSISGKFTRPEVRAEFLSLIKSKQLEIQ